MAVIDLAGCADFELGAVVVRPSSRELVTSGGVVMIEPKMMQVLVTLVAARGRVVSRDELVAQCWNGRVVGDDAVNRIIGKLRRLAEGPAAGAFAIETVPRTGHRLVPAAGQPDVAPPESLTAAHRHRWRWLFVPAAVAALLLAARARDRAPAPVAPPAPALPVAVSDLETRGLAAMFENTPEQTEEGIGYLRQATALAPRSAPVWGSLAMAYVLSLGWTPPAERAAVADRVRDAAAHGLALDPHESRSAAALVSLRPTFGRWPAKEAALAAAVAGARPDFGPLAYQRVQFLMAVGRDREALPIVAQLVKVSPLIPWIQAAHIDLLAGAGRLEEADRAADKAQGIWPRGRLIWFTRFDLAAFGGQPARALAMAQDAGGWPRQTTPSEMAAAARTARALVTRDAADIDAALAAVPVDQAAAERRMRAAVALGRMDIAVATARALLAGRLSASPRATMLPLIGMASEADPPTAALFLPPAAALWRDPEFVRLAAATGLRGGGQRAAPPARQP